MSHVEKIIEIVHFAGEILVEKLESGFSIHHKDRIDLVTDADQESEKYVIEQLAREYPDYNICAEEQGWLRLSMGDFVWFVDPLDGTTNFAHGFPYFAVSVGLAKGDEMILGVVYNPVSTECFVAERGSGAFLNGQKIGVSSTATLQKSLLVTGFPYDVATTKNDNMDEFSGITRMTQGVRRTGSAALDLCNVACGRFDAYWEQKINPWDVAAGSLILTEAGGILSNCSGESFDLYGSQIVASNGLLHQELIQALRRK